MKVTVEVELGNDAMQTAGEVLRALTASFRINASANVRMCAGEEGVVMDVNGNRVGKWEVMK